MSSPSPSKTPNTVPQGHVGLILLEEGESAFYLQIPLDIINSLCLMPRKYLLFLGWCILGIEGVLDLQNDGPGMDIDGDLDDQQIYYYVSGVGRDLVRAIDLEVIKARTAVPSESTQTRNDFRKDLLERDIRCAWTGIGPALGEGLHIIPYKRGSEWFSLIVENRPQYNEDVTALNDINNIRNGVFANNLIHGVFDPRQVAILKTPNRMLATNDVPPRQARGISADVSYPTRSRYTLQWLANPDTYALPLVPNNGDATFEKYNKRPKPSDLLLHYNYGAAAVKNWGRGTDILQNLTNHPRPQVPVPATTGLSKTTHDKGTVRRKLAAAWNSGGAGAESSTAGAGRSAAGDGTEGLVELEGQAWDEDDVMLFFWGNSQAAKERHLKRVSENTSRMEQWRGGIPQVSV